MNNSAFDFEYLKKTIEKQYPRFILEIDGVRELFILSDKENDIMNAMTTRDLTEVLPFVRGFYAGIGKPNGESSQFTS